MSQIFRVERNKNFTVMSNHHFKNKSLSLKVKGLLSLISLYINNSCPLEKNYFTEKYGTHQCVLAVKESLRKELGIIKWKQLVKEQVASLDLVTEERDKLQVRNQKMNEFIQEFQKRTHMLKMEK